MPPVSSGRCLYARIARERGAGSCADPTSNGESHVKRARKRRSRKGNAANHGRKPNA